MIADSETCYKAEETHLRPDLYQISDGVPQGVPQCLCTICLRFNAGVKMQKTAKFSEYDSIYVERINELTAHQYLLCSETVRAYVMSSRSWRKWTQFKKASYLQNRALAKHNDGN